MISSGVATLSVATNSIAVVIKVPASKPATKPAKIAFVLVTIWERSAAGVLATIPNSITNRRIHLILDTVPRLTSKLRRAFPTSHCNLQRTKMRTKIKRPIAFVLLSGAFLAVLFSLPNTPPNSHAQTGLQVTVPGIVSTGSKNPGMHTRADTLLPSARYGVHVDLNQASVTLDPLDIGSVTMRAPNQIGVNRSVALLPKTR